MRNIDISEKKNDFIKNFMSNTSQNDYLQYIEQVKQIKNYYDNRKNLFIQNPLFIDKNSDNSMLNSINPKALDDKHSELLQNIILNENDNQNQKIFLGKKRNLLNPI